MNSTAFRNSRGTISLVALCFVAVIGIVLGSYLTLCSRAMTLSNRSYQAGVAQQLAEFGLEEGLRAFNKNDWSNWASNPTNMTSGAWTLDTTNKRASRTITFTSGKLGQGLTATVKIRIDNYDAHVLGATYSSTVAYNIDDLVGSNGIWYRSIQNNNQNNSPLNGNGYPNLNYWAPEPVPWAWSSNHAYTVNSDVVCYNGVWYRCSTSHSSSTTFNASNWTALPLSSTNTPAVSLAVLNNTNYNAGCFAFRVGDGKWYRCLTSYNSGSSWDASKWDSVNPPFISWSYRSGIPYNFNDQVFYSSSAGTPGSWYRCKVTSTINAPNNSDWEPTLTGIWAWEASKKYFFGDVVYYNSQWYRCIQAHSSDSITPSNTAYWSNTPRLSTEWQPGRQYRQNDVVRYKGIWFLYINASPSSGNLPMAGSSSYWAAAPAALSPWDSTRYYSLDDLVSHTNSGTTTWYRCIQPHKAATVPGSSGNWTMLTGAAYTWSPTAAYTSTSYASYGGAWYKCTNSHTGQSPNNTDYWTASWKNSMQPTGEALGAPMIYAEATVNIPNNPPGKSQLRAAISPAPLFPNAVGANTTLTVSGAGTVDSYDGSVRAMSNGIPGTYTYGEIGNAPFNGSNANIGFSAVLAAGGSSYPSLSLLSSTTVKGHIAAKSDSTHAVLTQLANGAFLQNSDGTVTSFVSPQNNVDLTRISPSAYIPQFDPMPLMANWGNTAKSTALIEPSGSGATLNIGYAGATTPARYSFADNLTISSSSSIATLNINGPVILYLGGYLKVDSGGGVKINNTGFAEIHLTDALQVLSTSNGIDNKTQDPKRLIIISDTTGSNDQYYNDDSKPFYGLIYAPKIDLSNNSTAMNFGYTTPTSPTLYGAVSARKVTFTNNANVHYDTSLRYATIPGVDQPYTVTDWRILPQSEQATMP